MKENQQMSSLKRLVKLAKFQEGKIYKNEATLKFHKKHGMREIIKILKFAF